MKTIVHFILALSLFCGALRAEESAKLAPSQKLTFDFPDLPETFFAAGGADKRPARLSACLPDDYSADKTFPIFVFIQGGSGGSGDGASSVRNIIGPRGYIAVNLPLFKDKPSATASTGIPGIDPSKMIMIDDAAKIGSSYQVMLQKLFDTVPNIAPEGNTIGGFSNGAHATGALIASKNEFILKHFSSFVFLEGGGPLVRTPDALQQPELKHCRFLALLGDQFTDPKRKELRDGMLNPFKKEVEALKLDFTWITMVGYGHEQPADYLKLIAKWVRREELPTVAPKAATEKK